MPQTEVLERNHFLVHYLSKASSKGTLCTHHCLLLIVYTKLFKAAYNKNTSTGHSQSEVLNFMIIICLGYGVRMPEYVHDHDYSQIMLTTFLTTETNNYRRS